MTYGERFRELRVALGLDQYDLAHRLYGFRKRQPSVAGIEATAGRIPRLSSIRRHARALECQVSDLVGPVNDTWVDRARRGEFDTHHVKGRARASPHTEPRPARGTRTGP